MQRKVRGPCVWPALLESAGWQAVNPNGCCHSDVQASLALPATLHAKRRWS